MSRFTAAFAPRRLLLVGLVIAVFGVVDLIWTQVDAFPGDSGRTPLAYRWELASGPVEVIGVGVLIVVAAQILAALQNPVAPDDDPPPYD